MFDFSAKLSAKVSNPTVHSLTGTVYAQNMPGYIADANVTTRFLRGTTPDGLTKTWPLSKISSRMEAGWLKGLYSAKLTFGVLDDPAFHLGYESFQVVMATDYKYYSSGWDMMMDNNPQYKSQVFVFNF